MKIWSPKRERALFVHIPKTAGMTLRAALGSQYALEDRAPAVDWAGLRSLPRPLDHYKLYAGHFRYFLRRLLPADTKVVTFLRDPVERAISHLKHLAYDPQFHDLHKLANGRDLRAIAQDPQIMSSCSNVMVGYLSRPQPFFNNERLSGFPPEDECCVAPENIDEALIALNEIDFVGFVDNFDDDFARLCQFLGLHPPATLPVINSAMMRQDEAYADAELTDIVREANALDCAFYAEARRRRDERAPLTSRAERIADLVRSGVYSSIEQPTAFPVGGPLPGYGFWPADNGDAGQHFRWTGPERELVLELPISARNTYVLVIKIYAPRNVGQVTISLNGNTSELHWPNNFPTQPEIRILMPASLSDTITTITVAIDSMVSASTLDRRLVGFIIENIIITN